MANEYLKKFKKLFSSGNSKFKLAARYHFFITFSFTDSIDGRFNSIKWNDDIGYLVQKLDVPNFVLRDIQSVDDLTVKNQLGAYRIIDNATFLPETNELTITFLDTELPIFESFFFPWMKAVSTSQQPNKNFNKSKERYPRALIRIRIYDNENTKKIITYEINGAFPIHVDTPTLNYASNDNSYTRTVVFAFNEIKVMLEGKLVADADVFKELNKAKKYRMKQDKALRDKFKNENPLNNLGNNTYDSGLNNNELQNLKNNAVNKAQNTVNKNGGGFSNVVKKPDKIKPQNVIGKNAFNNSVDYGLNIAPDMIKNRKDKRAQQGVLVNNGISSGNTLLRSTIRDLQNNKNRR